MSSTKTIVIGKKNKKKNKKENIRDFLNDFIPRFTEEDIPENDLLIDNSFELKEYKPTKNTETISESVSTNSNIIPTIPLPKSKSVEIPIEKTIEKPIENPIGNTIKKPLLTSTKIKSEAESETESETESKETVSQTLVTIPDNKVSTRTIVKHTTTNNHSHSIQSNYSNSRQFEDIVYNYNKKKTIYQPFDTVSTQSSILDIMSMSDINKEQLQKIKKNVSVSKRKLYKPSYNKVLLKSNKLHTYPTTSINTKTKDNRKHNEYNEYYNKYYGIIKNKESIYSNHKSEKINNSIKNIRNPNISTIRHILYNHGVISKNDIHMPESLLLDLYAMLSDQNCKFNIKQFT